jgi:probable F420-dependent oxidoreductase
VIIRIGIGLGGAPVEPATLATVVDGIDRLGFDSIWLAEVLTAGGPDPIAGLAWAAAHNGKIKLGTTLLGPGRNVVRLAKSLATLDVLSGGRLLVTIVPGLARDPERSAVGADPTRRGSLLDEILPLLRRLWAGEQVSHDGLAGAFEAVSIDPLPVQQPLEMWLGGMAPAALRRCGELADGWLPALCTPAEAAAGREVVEGAASRAGRTISPEHFGVSIGYAREPLRGEAVRQIESRSRGRPAAELVPVGLDALRATIQAFVAEGFSKFVVRPVSPPLDWDAELESLSEAVGDLQS